MEHRQRFPILQSKVFLNSCSKGALSLEVRQAYQQVAIRQRRDPVLVNTCGPDRILMQCFPVTPNGGIMVRAPYFAYTGATTAAVLAQKPTGYNYDVCGAAVPFCNRTTPGASTTYNWAGMPGPFPPASNASNRSVAGRPTRGRCWPPALR